MADDTCTCCAGETEGSFIDICAGCLAAVLHQDRDAHPHPRSPAQEELYRQSATGGRIETVMGFE